MASQWMFDLTFTGRTLLGTTISRKTNDRTLLARDLATLSPRWEQPLPKQSTVLVGHDGTWVATFDEDAIRVWDLPTGQLLRQFNQRAFGVAALPGDVVLCLGNGAVFALGLRSGLVEKLFVVGATQGLVVDVPTLRLACLADQALQVWDLKTRAQVFAKPCGWHDKISFRGDELVLAELNGPIVVDAKTGAQQAALTAEGHTPPWGSACSPNGRWLATSHGDQIDNHAPIEDHVVRVWDLDARKLQATHPVDAPGWPSAMRMNDDGSVDCAHAEWDLRVWRIG